MPLNRLVYKEAAGQTLVKADWFTVTVATQEHSLLTTQVSVPVPPPYKPPRLHLLAEAANEQHCSYKKAQHSIFTSVGTLEPWSKNTVNKQLE